MKENEKREREREKGKKGDEITIVMIDLGVVGASAHSPEGPTTS